jgi:hypothetical protein
VGSPTLVRSQVLDAPYGSAAGGAPTKETALERLARFSELKIRYLGDEVLRRRAWSVAEQLGWESIGAAECVALTHLQADAFITLDQDLAAEVGDLVDTAPLAAVLQGSPAGPRVPPGFVSEYSLMLGLPCHEPSFEPSQAPRTR